MGGRAEWEGEWSERVSSIVDSGKAEKVGQEGWIELINYSKIHLRMCTYAWLFVKVLLV